MTDDPSAAGANGLGVRHWESMAVRLPESGPTDAARLLREAAQRSLMLREALRITGVIGSGGSPGIGAEVAEAAALVGQGDLAVLVMSDAEDPLEVAVIGASGTIAQAWLQQPLEDLRQLARVVIQDGQPRVSPELEAPSNGHSPIVSVVGVPLPALPETGGALLVGRVRGAPPFTTADVARLAEFAGHLDGAWTIDRLRTRRAGEHVVEDQFRVAADIDEHVITRLFSLSLELISVRRALRTEDAPRRLLDAVSELDATITWLRRSILEPADTGPWPGRLRSQVLAVLDEHEDERAAERGIRLDLRGLDVELPSSVADEAAAVVREIMSHVAVAPAGGESTVRISLETAEIVVEVSTSGCEDAPIDEMTVNRLRQVAESGTWEADAGTRGGRIRWTCRNESAG